MDLRFSEQDEDFRREIAGWLAANLVGEFAELRGRGGPGDESALLDLRLAWEQKLGDAGWIGLGWPSEAGGRGLPLLQQVIFHEEYARAGGPGRLGHLGENLAGPTILAFGSDEQKRRFLPEILSGTTLWCQGYSEPAAGSDLANVQTRAELCDDEWVITGQKLWTSGAAWSDWCFVLCRTDAEARPKHRGLSYLLVPMRQEAIEVRPIVQITGDSEFGEVFFDGARTAADNLVGEVNGGWKVAMGTLSFERGASTLGQQLAFQNELQQVIDAARANGKSEDPLMRQRLADAWIGLRIMRMNALRTLHHEGPDLARAALITKLYWASWHRALGELAMDVLGPEAEIIEGAPYELTPLQRLFLFARSDTIYAGSNEIQRNLIAERALGLPREPRSAERTA